MLPTITPLEKAFLLRIEEFIKDYAECTIEDDGEDQMLKMVTWTPTTDNASVGVLSSLVKKGLVETDYAEETKSLRRSKDSQCWFTRLGLDVLIANK